MNWIRTISPKNFQTQHFKHQSIGWKHIHFHIVLSSAAGINIFVGQFIHDPDSMDLILPLNQWQYSHLFIVVLFKYTHAHTHTVIYVGFILESITKSVTENKKKITFGHKTVGRIEYYWTKKKWRKKRHLKTGILCL